MTNVRYRFGRHVLDLAKRELLDGGVPVALPARVFECLVHLIEQRERAVDRDELAQAVFSRSDVSDAQLAQIILRSRRAIGDDGQEQRAIRTVPRFGYPWVAETPVGAGPRPEAPAHEALPPAGDAPPLPSPASEPAPASPPPARGPVRARRRAGALAVVAVAVLAALVAAFAWQRRAGPAPAAAVADAAMQRAIMVLPTRVEGPGDVAWARLGLMDDLADRIRRGGLPALSSDTTLSLLREAGDGGAVPDMGQLRDTARVDWIVES